MKKNKSFFFITNIKKKRHRIAIWVRWVQKEKYNFFEHFLPKPEFGKKEENVLNNGLYCHELQLVDNFKKVIRDLSHEKRQVLKAYRKLFSRLLKKVTKQELCYQELALVLVPKLPLWNI